MEMNKPNIAKAGAELALRSNHKMTRYGWAHLDQFFDTLEADTVERTHAVYEAGGPNAVCAYVSDCRGERDKDIAWGYCPDCEESVPTYPGDDGRICLVCWGAPVSCEKCHSYNVEIDFTCVDCGEEVKSWS